MDAFDISPGEVLADLVFFRGAGANFSHADSRNTDKSTVSTSTTMLVAGQRPVPVRVMSVRIGLDLHARRAFSHRERTFSVRDRRGRDYSRSGTTTSSKAVPLVTSPTWSLS